MGGAGNDAIDGDSLADGHDDLERRADGEARLLEDVDDSLGDDGADGAGGGALVDPAL